MWIFVHYITLSWCFYPKRLTVTAIGYSPLWGLVPSSSIMHCKNVFSIAMDSVQTLALDVFVGRFIRYKTLFSVAMDLALYVALALFACVRITFCTFCREQKQFRSVTNPPPTTDLDFCTLYMFVRWGGGWGGSSL